MQQILEALWRLNHLESQGGTVGEVRALRMEIVTQVEQMDSRFTVGYVALWEDKFRHTVVGTWAIVPK